MFVLITTVILCYFKWYSLKLGPRTWDSGSESQDLGPETWDLGSRNWDPVPRIQGPGPWTSRPRDTGPRTPYPATQELGPRIPGTGTQEPWSQDLVFRTQDLGPGTQDSKTWDPGNFKIIHWKVRTHLQVNVITPSTILHIFLLIKIIGFFFWS